MKKIISLLLAFTMMFSMLAMVQAADNETITISAGELTAADFNEEDGVYYVPIKVDKFHYDSADKGYAAIAFYVYFDSRKIKWDENIKYTAGTVKSVGQGGVESDLGFSCAINKTDTNELIMIWYSIGSTLCNEGLHDGTIIYLPFKPVEGAEGKATVKFTDAQFATLASESFMLSDNTGVVAKEGGIQLTEATAGTTDDFVVKTAEGIVPCNDITVEYNKHVNDLVLPETVTVKTDMGEVSNIRVDWDKSSYNGAVAGTYLLYGTLNADDVVNNVISNKKAYKATLKVNVSESANPGTEKLSVKRAAKNPRFNVLFGKMFYNALFMATEQ